MTSTALVPRTLTEQIDHIKSLVTRLHSTNSAASTVRPAEGVITAQLFRSARRRSNSAHEPVSAAQVLQVLDSLKRRVRQEQSLLRRPSEIDPETESEEDDQQRGLDEREVEFEGLREELAHERARREEWLEDAEARVDGLMREKEELGREVEEVREDRDGLKSKVEWLAVELRDSEAKRVDVEKKVVDLEGEVSELRGVQEELESEHGDKVKALEQENEKLEAEVERQRTEKDETEAVSKQKHDELQERYDKLEADHASSNTTIEDLRRDATSQAEERDTLVERLEQHNKSLADAQRDVQLHGKEFKQLLEQHEGVKAELDSLKKERDDLNARHDTLLKDREASSDQAKQDFESAKTEHEKTLQSLREKHQQENTASKTKHDDLQARFDSISKEKNELEHKMETRLRDLRAEHENILQSSADENASQVGITTQKLDALQASYDKLLVEHDGQVRDLRSRHEKEFNDSTLMHEERQRQLEAELEGLKRWQHELEEASRTHEDELRRLHAQVAHAQREREQAESGLKGRVTQLVNKVRDSELLAVDLTQQKSAFEQRALDAEISRSSREAELNSSIAQKENDLGTVRTRLAELEAEVQKLSSDVATKDSEMQKLSSNLASKDSELSEANQSHEQRIRELEASWSAKANEAAKAHSRELQELQEVSNVTSRTRDDLQRQLQERDIAAESKLASVREEGTRELEKTTTDLKMQLANAQEALNAGKRDMESDLQRQLQERDVASESKLTSVREEGTRELEKATADLKTQLADAQEALSAGQRDIDSTKAKHEDAVLQLRNDHGARVLEMQSNFDKLQKEAKEGFDAQLAAAATASSAKSADLESQRERALSDSSSKYQAELASLRATHEETSQEMLRKVSALEARLERTGTDHAQTLSDKEELEYKISQLKSSHEQALAGLTSEHEESMTAAVVRVEQQMEERLLTQIQVHSNEFDRLQENLNGELQNLQIQLEEAAELRHSQMQAADDERTRALGELNGKLSSAEDTAAALQGRLDMELTSRAEVERSLAEMRRQRLEDEKRLNEQLEKMQYDVAALQVERDALARKATAMTESMDKDLSDGTGDGTTDVTVLKRRLAAAEAELSEMRRSGEHGRAVGGDSELARQNEFLASQLQAMIATRSVPSASVASRSDAGAQTEPVVEETNPVPQRQKPVVRDITVPKQRSLEPQPVSPKTPRQANPQRSSDRAWKTRSFEDYLSQAQAELSELGSVISQNEALFAQKIQEHVGDLQRAKDQLAAEYKDKFDSLLADRQKMEKDISAKSAEEFARERQELVEKYGAYHDEPAQQAAAITSLSTPKRNALRSAEQQLVTQYNQRVVKRKSQVAMKHAEDFQSLTQDYDRRLAELLGSRDKLGVDLSVEPDQFEKDFGELEVMSAKLESERGEVNGVQQQAQSPPVEDAIAGAVHDARTTKAQPTADRTPAPKSQLPKRSLTSTPRTPTSIPRAMPFAGRHSSMDYQSKRQSTDRLPHIRQQSAMRAQSPIEEQPSPAMPSSRTKSAHRMSSQPVTNMSAAQDLGIEPADFEQRVGGQEGRRASPEMQRAKTDFNKRRSMRLSSGIMYNGWQAPQDL